MALKQKLLSGNATVREVPPDVYEPLNYPEQGTKLKFSEEPANTFTLELVDAPNPAKFPGDWNETNFDYLEPGQGNDPVIDEHDYKDRERLYGVIDLMAEQYHVWFYIKLASEDPNETEDRVWCAARNTNLAAPKNGGWKFDPP